MAGLDHIRWLGGGTGSGKTTVARQIAGQYGLSIYSADAAIRVHSYKLSATAAPRLECFRRMSMHERWVQREPGDMYRTFPWFHGEGSISSLKICNRSRPTRSRLRRDFGYCRIWSVLCSPSRPMGCG